MNKMIRIDHVRYTELHRRVGIEFLGGEIHEPPTMNEITSSASLEHA